MPPAERGRIMSSCTVGVGFSAWARPRCKKHVAKTEQEPVTHEVIEKHLN